MAVQAVVDVSKLAAQDLLVRCKRQTAAEAAAAAAAADASTQQQQQQGGGASEPQPPPAAAAAGATSPAVDDLVTSALGLLTTVQRCTAGPEVLPGTVVAGALDSALAGLRSKVVGNVALVDQVATSLAQLKYHLTKLLTV
jgi:hypothetical protein